MSIYWLFLFYYFLGKCKVLDDSLAANGLWIDNDDCSPFLLEKTVILEDASWGILGGLLNRQVYWRLFALLAWEDCQFMTGFFSILEDSWRIRDGGLWISKNTDDCSPFWEVQNRIIHGFLSFQSYLFVLKGEQNNKTSATNHKARKGKIEWFCITQFHGGKNLKNKWGFHWKWRSSKTRIPNTNLKVAKCSSKPYLSWANSRIL